MPDTAMSIAAAYLISRGSIVPEQWGGRMPDTAASAAAAYSIYRGPH